MQYTITVNQFAFRKHFPLLNISHAAIVDWFSRFTHSSKIARLEYEGKTYYWLQYDKAREELPILGISNKDSMRRLVKALCTENILEAHPDNQAMGRSYFAFGDRYEFAHTSANDLVPQSTGGCEKNQGSYRKERGGRTEKNEGVVPECTTDPYINDHDSKDQRERSNAHEPQNSLSTSMQVKGTLKGKDPNHPVPLLTEDPLTTAEVSTGSAAAIVHTYSNESASASVPVLSTNSPHEPINEQAWIQAHNSNKPEKWGHLYCGWCFADTMRDAAYAYIKAAGSQQSAIDRHVAALQWIRVSGDKREKFFRDLDFSPKQVFNPEKLPMLEFADKASRQNLNPQAVAQSGLSESQISQIRAEQREAERRRSGTSLFRHIREANHE